MAKLHTKGFSPVLTPDIARTELAQACGFNPRDQAQQIYFLENKETCLIGTSEITLAGLHADSIIENLPRKYAGFSHCFRMEAGKGAAAKGLFRLHQFSKVEMFAFIHPQESANQLDEVIEIQKEILKELDLPFRVIDIPANDLGAAAYRKFDLEVLVPSRGYTEVTSASNCTDFQAIRLNSMFREKGEKLFVHTVNGTACAVPRIIMSILECHQANNMVKIPECLHPFLPFKTINF